MLRRKVYETLSKWAQSPYSYVPLVVGARQIGKTFVIREFLNNTFDNVVEINFISNPEYRGIFEGSLEIDDLITKISVNITDVKLVPGRTAIFVDEIQGCPDAKTAFKQFVEDGRFRVIASGTSLGMSSNQPRSNPVGFLSEIKMYPLDFEEFLWSLGIDESVTESIRGNLSTKTAYSDSVLAALERHFSLYMIVGGMPDAVQAYLATKNIQDVRSVQETVLDGYRDNISKHFENPKKNRVNACFDSIPTQLSEKSKKFRYRPIDNGAVPTLKTYENGIRWMKDASLVNLSYNLECPAQPLREHKVDKMFKIYMGDTGLLTYLLGLNVAKSLLSGDTRVNNGAVMENVVGQCLVSSGFDLFYFRSNTLEIDFILQLGTSVAAVEVKSGNNKQSKSLDSLNSKYKVRRRMKFEKGNIYTDEKGIEHYPLFACSFIRDIQPEPEVDLDVDTESFIREFRKQ